MSSVGNVEMTDIKTANTAVAALSDEGGKAKLDGVTITADPVSSGQEADNGKDLVDAHKDDVLVVTGADAANYLLPLRDDGDPALTFRSMVLATLLCAFAAVLQQLYTFKPTYVTIQGTFIVLIAYFLGKGWAAFLPRGDHWDAKWRAQGTGGKRPFWISCLLFINPGPWGLKEHAICAITASSASNASASSWVFACQKLFYDLPLSAGTVIMSTVSIGLFGYGLCGIFRPVTVWHVESVYWGQLPTVKTLQGLHWQGLKDSKPLRYFWYAFGSMFGYEFVPAYMFPWLNSVSVPCLASMHATGAKAGVLTTLFGGSLNNEGLGLFNFSFDWQYITSYQTALPLKMQLNSAIGLFVCYIAMLAIYYGNAWGAKALPFMATQLLNPDGSDYPIAEVFVGGVLDETALAKYGIPKLSATFAWAMFCANAGIGALVVHCILFWGKDIMQTYRSARKGSFNDRHHEHMSKHYKEVPWWWYAFTLLLSFVLGLIVVLKEDVTLPAWAYIVSLLLGSLIAPFSTILFARFGNGIATNNLSKLVAGLLVPGRPVGNMYFAAWSHNVILETVNLSGDLKMGEYLKIPPRVMFLTQIWGTVFGGFINYVVMITIVKANAALLASGNGNAAWSGVTLQAYNTNATSWALARYLYTFGDEYYMVPLGLLIGGALVVAHRIFVKFVPRIRSFDTSELNLAQFIQYAGYIPYNQAQTCVIWSQLAAGFFCQYYLRNWRPRIFKDFMYLVTAAWDGGSLLAIFVLSFAVFGAGGPSIPFPLWWGNNYNGNYDYCPVTGS